MLIHCLQVEIPVKYKKNIKLADFNLTVLTGCHMGAVQNSSVFCRFIFSCGLVVICALDEDLLSCTEEYEKDNIATCQLSSTVVNAAWKHSLGVEKH